MKKIFSGILILTMVLGLCACNMGKSDEATPTTEPAPTPTTQPATEPPASQPETTLPPIKPNVPDPNVDDDHLIDPTEGGKDGTGSGTNGSMS